MTEQQKKIDQLNALVSRLRKEYADDPNVRSIGWGLKKQKDKLQDQLSIIFFVRRKLVSPRSIEAARSRVIPEEIEGYPTDVEESNMGIVSAGQRDDEEYDPLIGGPATSNAEGHIYWFNSGGTLGMLLRNVSDDAPVALSNWHVWADGGDEGDAIIQPGHPTGGDHVEGITKVAACGPLLTSLIEWEAPSPLTWALYGGAAAAAIAAAASDYRDPIRRGQDQTPTNPDELTLQENVSMEIEYPNLPLPGRPFHTKVKWQYKRQTEDRILVHEVEEERTNIQFLLGKMVVTDRKSYKPGERITLTAAIWDYQPRPCNAYHVVAHLIPHNRPDFSLRVVLHPTACPRTFPTFPPEDEQQQETCVIFDKFETGEYPHRGTFDWLAYVDLSQTPARIVDWLNGTKAMLIRQSGLRVIHAPSNQMTAKVAQFTNEPVSLTAYNANGQVVGQAVAPNQQGVIHELKIVGDGIVSTLFTGGGGEGLLISYCIAGVGNPSFTTAIGTTTAANIARELPGLAVTNQRLRANRCCFTGSIAMPPTENPGKWDVHLTVQNVNNVPDGTPPEEAAQIIGGHLLSNHAVPNVLGCLVTMLLDHAFDVI